MHLRKCYGYLQKKGRNASLYWGTNGIWKVQNFEKLYHYECFKNVLKVIIEAGNKNKIEDC